MTFAVGNRWWEARSSHGRNPIFNDPAELWAACCEYFEWVTDNPLTPPRIGQRADDDLEPELCKIRAMTIAGLCTFLGVARSTWDNWKNQRADFLGVIDRVEGVMYQQKFEYAAANMLNPNLIARELGLADKTEQTGSLQVIIADKDADL